MYHIFADSFASGKEALEDKTKCIRKDGKEYRSVHGGTLKGIMENVDYLKNLGVNCVYLNPIFAASSYHKYDTIDYFEIDPCFGTKEELKDALLIGEIWEDSNVWLMGDQFDEKVNRMLFRYPMEVNLAQMNFLDIHDIPRFFSYCNGDKKAFQAAVFFLMTCVGAPSVFYGDEHCIEGMTEPEYRTVMPWETRDGQMEEFFRECIAMRKSLPARKTKQRIEGERFYLDAMQGEVFEAR